MFIWLVEEVQVLENYLVIVNVKYANLLSLFLLASDLAVIGDSVLLVFGDKSDAQDSLINHCVKFV